MESLHQETDTNFECDVEEEIRNKEMESPTSEKETYIEEIENNDTSEEELNETLRIKDNESNKSVEEISSTYTDDSCENNEAGSTKTEKTAKKKIGRTVTVKKQQMDNVSTEVKAIGEEVSSILDRSNEVVNVDNNNNITSREDTLKTPEMDSRGISPEIFCMTHMSPTELYGKDHLIGLPRLQTRSVSSQSKTESTLNTPDPGFVEDLDLESCFTNTTEYCKNRGMKRKSLGLGEIESSENQVPKSCTQQTFQSVTTISSSFSEESHSLYTTPLAQGMSCNQSSYMHRTQQAFAKPQGQLNYNANGTLYGSGNAACRLDFQSPIDLSTPRDFRNPVDFDHDNSEQFSNYPRILSFVSNQSFLPQNITRPLPTFPPCSAYSRYEAPQAGLNYNNWATPVHFSQCNFVPVDKKRFCSNQSLTTFTGPNLESLQYHPGNQHLFHSYSNRFPARPFWNASSQLLEHPNFVPRQDICRMSMTANNNFEILPHKTWPHTSSLDIATPCISNTPSPNECSLEGIDERNRNTDDIENNNLYGAANENLADITQESTRSKDTNVIVDENSSLLKKSETVVSNDQRKQNTDVNANSLTEENETFRQIGNGQEETEHSANTEPNASETADHVVDKLNADINTKDEGTSWKSKNTKISLNAKSKTLTVSISDFGSKTVKQLLQEANSNDTEVESSVEKEDKCSLRHNKAFIERFMKERKTKSPMSAFCAALHEPKKKPNRPLAPAEPRIPIPALLGPNEVPMKYSGTMLVPYFNPAVMVTSSMPTTSNTTYGTTTGIPTTRHTENNPREMFRRYSLTGPRLAGPIPLTLPTVAVPLYANPVNPSVPASCPAAATPVSNLHTILPQSVLPKGERTQKFGLLPSGIKPFTATSSAYFGFGRSSTPDSDVRCDMLQGVQCQPKKSWKARHYSFAVLRIGSYKYTCDSHSFDKAARVKFLFSKRKLVYEYQVNSNDDSADTKNMAEIIIPFSSIVGLYLEHREMKLEVDSAPLMYSGVRTQEKNQCVYDRNKQVDLTNGELEQCPYHLLHFKTTCTTKIRSDMELFDPKFRSMLQRSFVLVPSKSLRGTSLAIDSYLLQPDRPSSVYSQANTTRRCPLTSSTGSLLGSMNVTGCGSHCDCKDGCCTASCTCCSVGIKCAAGGCTCMSCRNPLNVLHNIGLPADKAATDPCLMDNIYQISDLDAYVRTPLQLECCQSSTLLFTCIPGEIACPNLVCGARYKFSWCSARLCDESMSPRNHCRKCRRCTDYRNSHCQTCNMCYFAGEHGSFKCPVCSSYDSVLDSSTDSGTN